jgi:hypothetical protein
LIAQKAISVQAFIAALEGGFGENRRKKGDEPGINTLKSLKHKVILTNCHEIEIGRFSQKTIEIRR